PNSSTEGPISKQHQLKLLHRRLMAVYVYELEGVQEGHRRSWPRRMLAAALSMLQAEGDATRSYKRGPVTRGLVESHIKGKLRELRVAYAQIEQSVSEIDSVPSFRGWLKDTQESLDRFSATLTVMTFVRRIVKALWPLVIGLLAVNAIWSALFK